MTEFQFPQINPTGPIPAPNTAERGDRPAVRAGRELSAYGDMDYPEACVSKERRLTSQALKSDAATSDAARFGSFDPSI